MLTIPPSGVNFSALDNKFSTTCRRRSESPRTVPASAATDDVSVTDLASKVGRDDSTTPPTSAGRSTGSIFRVSLPATMRLTSSRSLISRLCCCTLRSMTSRPRRVAGASSVPPRSSRSQPSIALRGLRSSCETIARNSSFRRSASRSASPAIRWRVASSRARRSSSISSTAEADAGVGVRSDDRFSDSASATMGAVMRLLRT